MINLADIGKYRENNRLEAKRALGGLPHSIWETYSAFANTQGGIILLGVVELEDKSFAPVALPDPELLVEDFWTDVNDRSIVSANILSPKNVHIEECEGCRIVVIEVPPAPLKHVPVYCGADPLTGSYYRCGEGDFRFSPDQVRRMMPGGRKKK